MRTTPRQRWMFTIFKHTALGIGLLSAAACTQADSDQVSIGGHLYRLDHARQLQLPKALREISGLTFDGGGFLYGHNDEKGVIYQIDFLAGRVLKRFMLTGKVRADFEGIAYLGEQLFLIDSNGVLFETRIGDADEQVSFRRLTEGLDCEVEGLTASPDARSLLAACKNLADKTNDIRIYRWALGAQDWEARPAVQIAESVWQGFLRGTGLKPVKKLQPTGLTRTLQGNLLLLAGRQHLLLEFTLTGELVSLVSLDPDWHRQAEGIAISEDGHLLIADEGNKKSPGVLTVHEPIR